MTILVSGLVNVETTLKIDQFPFDYAPVRYPFFGVKSTVSGVGFNVAKALAVLGNSVDFLSLIGKDSFADLVRDALSRIPLDDGHVLSLMDETPQSVILYDTQGTRAINVDLKDIQERAYPVESFRQALFKTSLAVLCNIGFSRPMLPRAKSLGVPIATDVHTISNIDDEYNRDYMAHATILFQSHEYLPCSPEEWVRRLWQQYGTPIVVIGLGGDGAVLGVKDDHFIERVPAIITRPIISTIGAGDALFSAFVHTFSRTNDPYLSMNKALVFASHKIGVAGAADGFLSADELDAAYMKTLQ